MNNPILTYRPIFLVPRGVRLCRPRETPLDLLPLPTGVFTRQDSKNITGAVDSRRSSTERNFP